jgi:polyhydroxyalkanoate synthesis repressor PhaR
MPTWTHPPHAAAESKQPIVIKKYRNRRLYNARSGQYATLQNLADLVKQGEEIVVYDTDTGKNITRHVLIQIVLNQESNGQHTLLPITLLRQLIGLYDTSIQMMAPLYLEMSIESLARERKKLRQMMVALFETGIVRPVEEQVIRNSEMLDRVFANFALFASKGGLEPFKGK